VGVPRSEQLTIDRKNTAPFPWPGESAASPAAEHSARDALRAQIARLEHELSGLVASGFPHISPTHGEAAPTSSARHAPGTRGAHAGLGLLSGPRLLTLGELERARDQLAARVADTQRLARKRAEFEHSSLLLLEAMKLEPGRYKFVRLPVTDLGEGGCGAWEVRPRLGLIGMLAGWWHVKLSSGCPLARGRAAARPAPRKALRPA
jgi:hypothetical protein